LKLRGAGSYRDQGRRLDYGYWLKDNQLLVRGVQDFSEDRTIHPSGLEEETSEAASSFGYNRLVSIGFHKSRCIDALERMDGDVGAAVELLMAEGFRLAPPGRGGGSSDPEGDQPALASLALAGGWAEQREEERTALESIYEEAFQEKLPGRVWELRLEDLDHLWKHLPGGNRKDVKSRRPAREEKGVCPWFSAGHCKFGKKCRQKHIQPDNSRPAEDGHLRGDAEEQVFTLEVRLLRKKFFLSFSFSSFAYSFTFAYAFSFAYAPPSPSHPPSSPGAFP
jgi:ATP-dependent RNA helicase DHX57